MRPLRRLLHGLGALGLLLAGSVVFMTALAPSACACNTKEMAYLVTMKSDLRNLAGAEDAWHEWTGEFAGKLADLGVDPHAFKPSTNVVIVIEHADSVRWRARATHTALRPTDSCTVLGRVTPSSEESFQAIQCDPDSSAMRERARGLDEKLGPVLFLNIAMIFMYGAWRQMRRALGSM